MKKNSLVRRFGILFILFALVTIVVSGLVAYSFQTRQYHETSKEHLKQMTSYLTDTILMDGDEMILLKKWFSEHSDQVEVPLNFREDLPRANAAFVEYVVKNYPGRAYGTQLTFNELDFEGQRLFVNYSMEWWFTVFFDARDRFNLSYVYFIYPDETKDHTMIYMFDPTLGTTKTADGREILILGDVVYEDPKLHKYMWEAWENGGESTGFDSLDNEYGHVYTYSHCVKIDGEKVGVLCADISVAQVRSDILHAVLIQSLASAVVLILASLIMFHFTRKEILERLVRLGKDIEDYSREKNPAIAEHLRNNRGREDELGALSDRFASMITELDDYMKNLQIVTAEKERIGAELNVAASIQRDLLPKIFPPFPGRKDMELYASMSPAREVGGDFFDFFMVDEDRLAMVVADVSGKGVPAALFMVIAKTLIKNRLQTGANPAEALMNVNNQLCEGNDSGMFVTVWIAVVDLKTGKVTEVNAGHEYPAIRGSDGTYSLIRTRHSPAVAIMEGMVYKQREFTLEPGNVIFMYTDGVTEATNANNELYGDERLTKALNRNADKDPEALLKAIRQDIDAFVGEAPQFDDLTMLSLVYYGPEGKKQNDPS
ncbi:MAG: SpoIIE family protein phosphatase [Clostridia bacterium]|nr:SpoIIE family protein phosphatase [Clostridia bacterium]